MTDVKRYEIEATYMDSDGYHVVAYQKRVEVPNGDYVLFTDYEAKCADYERLRDALEKLRDGFTPGDYVERIAREALTPPPAAGDARENDGTVAARKEKERAGSLDEADAPKAARKDKE